MYIGCFWKEVPGPRRQWFRQKQHCCFLWCTHCAAQSRTIRCKAVHKCVLPARIVYMWREGTSVSWRLKLLKPLCLRQTAWGFQILDRSSREKGVAGGLDAWRFRPFLPSCEQPFCPGWCFRNGAGTHGLLLEDHLAKHAQDGPSIKIGARGVLGGYWKRPRSQCMFDVTLLILRCCFYTKQREEDNLSSKHIQTICIDALSI